jgi:hypothetical protein
MKYWLAMIVLAFPAASAADEMASMQQAMELGSILAAEQECGLAYDQAAISVWIDQNVDPSDMGFASNLGLMTKGAEFNSQGMSDSQKVAHCRSIEQTARHFGFVK